jgi:tetratricopeptide (TPR) repeat protein
MRRPLVLATVIVLGTLAAGAARADLTCRADVDRRQVPAGGQLVLTLHAGGDTGRQPDHQRPRIEGVEVVPGGTSQSFHLVNGRSEHSLDVTYYLVVRTDQDFQVPAITFTAGDQTCTTEPIDIRVTAAGATPRGSAPPTGNRTGPADAPVGSGAQAGQPGDAYFITLTVDRDEVWRGQQIVLTFRYHRRKSPWNQPSYSAPRTEGFWRVDLPPERTYRRTIAGSVYDITEIRYALFPTRAGELVIEPARLEVAGDPFDRFFGRRSRGPMRLITDPIPIMVKELPSPRPAGFSGIVADRLDFTATVDRDTVPRGEPLALRLAVEADGFLKSFGGVPVPELDGLQLHDASENLREDVTGPRYQAAFEQEKAAVPLREGMVAIPPLELVYFDTGQGRYQSRTAEVPAIVVTPSDRPVVGDDPSGFRRTEIERIANDLAFVHPLDGPVRGRRWLDPDDPGWWLVLLVPWFALGLYRLHLRRLAGQRRDPVGRRRRQALSVARKRLDEAARDNDVDALARAILGFVADRTAQPVAAVGARDVAALADSQGRAQERDELLAVLAVCDQSRFGGEQGPDVAALARQVRPLLERLAARSSGRSTPVAGLLLAVGLAAAGGAAAQTDAPGVDPARLIAEANQAYTDGDLEGARARYLQARELGADAAVLHYNLGNTYARLGQLGRAIVNYERAIRRDPRDPDVRRNLAWVRSHTRDLELTGQGLPPVIAQLDAAAHRLSVPEWSGLLLLSSWLVAGLVAWTWRRGAVEGPLRRALIAAAAVALIVAAITATRWYEERWRQEAVVIVEEVEVRSGPATSFPVVFRVHDGLSLTVRGERDDWSRIALGGDWMGWVPSGTLAQVRQVQGR